MVENWESGTLGICGSGHLGILRQDFSGLPGLAGVKTSHNCRNHDFQGFLKDFQGFPQIAKDSLGVSMHLHGLLKDLQGFLRIWQEILSSLGFGRKKCPRKKRIF